MLFTNHIFFPPYFSFHGEPAGNGGLFLIAKSYKLKRELAEEFAEACEKAGVAQSRQIANMMQAFIDEQNKQ